MCEKILLDGKMESFWIHLQMPANFHYNISESCESGFPRNPMHVVSGLS